MCPSRPSCRGVGMYGVDHSFVRHVDGFFVALLLGDGVGVEVVEDVNAAGSSAQVLSPFWKKLHEQTLLCSH